MTSRAQLILARLAWFAPALLLLLTVHQAVTAVQLRGTWLHGEPAVAEVTGFDNTDRVDVTYGYVNLRVELPDGRVIEQNEMSLPYTLIPRVEGEERLEVRVRPEAAQPIVIARLMPAHWLIAATQSAIAFLGALLLGFGVFAWNRYLARHGDPARQQPGEHGEHPSEGPRVTHEAS